jgi:acetoin utilization protein AcuB
MLYGEGTMIVRDIMTTKIITVEINDTLAHAANLLRQHNVHHLPVIRKIYQSNGQGTRSAIPVCEGIISTQDIDVAIAVADRHEDGSQTPSWQERRISEVMHRAAIRVTAVASVSAAAQLLVDRGLHCLLVVEYRLIDGETLAILVGLITRSDLLMAFSRSMGASEPGMQLDIALPLGDTTPLARMLLLAATLRVHIRSILAAPSSDGSLYVATVRLGTINPTVLLKRLQEEGIRYSFGSPLMVE